MREYETAFLISPNLSEEDTDQIISQMAEIITHRKGKMIKEDRWGKRKLAYPIQKFEEAFYVFFHYEGEPGILSELERQFKQKETILRYLTVRKEVKQKARKRKRVAKEEEEPEGLKEESVETEEESLKEAAPSETSGKEK